MAGIGSRSSAGFFEADVYIPKKILIMRLLRNFYAVTYVYSRRRQYPRFTDGVVETRHTGRVAGFDRRREPVGRVPTEFVLCAVHL